MAWERGGRRAVALVLVLAVGSLAGCIGADGPGTDGQTPGTSGEAGTSQEDGGRSYDSSSQSNQPGSFSYQGAMGNQDKTENVTWTNPTARAQIAWQGSASSGSFTLTITDTTGQNVVYEKTIDGTTSGQVYEASGPGVPGQWILTFDFQGFTGSMQLSIQSA